MTDMLPDGRPEDVGGREVSLPEPFGEQIEEHVRRTHLAGLFLQSPSFMAVTRGPEHVFVNANPTYRNMVGEHRELIGRPARKAFPELNGQGFLELLDRVYEEEEPHVGREEPARLRRGDADDLETIWVCYSYHPLRDAEGNVSGILHHGIDVTERTELRRDLEDRVRQEAAVGELGRFALQSDRPSEILRRAVETAREVLDADAAALYRYRAEDGALIPADPSEVSGADDPPRPLGAEGSHLPGRAFREQGAAFHRGTPAGSDGEPVRLVADAAVAVAAVVPGGNGRPLGVLWAEARDGEAFDGEDVPILESVARIVAATLQRQEARRFRDTVVRNLPGLLYRCRNDRDWTMEFLSEGTQELTGYAPSELQGAAGTAYADLIHPDDRQEVWESVQEAVREGEPFQVQYRIRTREGEERWVWEQGRGVEPATGEPSVLEGYIFDITDWRRAREEAGWFDSVLQAAFRVTQEALFVVKLPERTIVECNPGAEELFGYPREEMLGQSTEILHVDSEHQEEFGRRSEERLRSQGYYRGEFEMRRKDGSVFPTDHSVTLVDGAQDPPGYAVSIVRDISERKERKARLERSRRLLQKYAAHLTEARERERAEIAREVHDELGQALTGLKFQLDRLTGAVGDDPELREAAARSQEILGSVFDRVRDLSESLRPPHLDSLGLRRALAQLVELCEESTGLEATFGFRGPDEGLGGDRNIHVYRVVQEALTNAARHADASRVRVEVEAGEDTWRVVVRDDGVGLPGGDAGELEGHGILGMRERARLLDGDVRVRDADGGGTEVLLEAPRETEPGDD